MIHLQPLERARLQRGVEHLHGLGARAEAEFLAELATRIGGMPAILGLLSEYQGGSRQMLRAVGGDRFPPPAMRLVPEARP